MGTSKDFFTQHIDWRVNTYYKLKMGGSCVNGDSTGNFKTVTLETLKSKQIQQSAVFDVSSKTLDIERLSAEISVKLKASKAITSPVRFHVAVVETDLDMVAVYGAPTANGQAHIYNIVRELITDSTGILISSLAVDQEYTTTKTFTRDKNCQNADSLRVVAWLQREDTREIIAAMQTNTSAIPAINPIVSKINHEKLLNLKIVNSSHNVLSFKLPFDGAKVVIFDASGKNIFESTITGKKNDPVSVKITQGCGINFLKILSIDGIAVYRKIFIK